jgi:hypothetical protein
MPQTTSLHYLACQWFASLNSEIGGIESHLRWSGGSGRAGGLEHSTLASQSILELTLRAS